MNLFFKILFIFFSFLVLHGTSAETVCAILNAPVNYIQNDYQHIVLTSQSLSQEIIVQKQNGDLHNCTFDKSFVSAINQEKLLLNSNKFLIVNNNINNLSTNIKSEIFIRAP